MTVLWPDGSSTPGPNPPKVTSEYGMRTNPVTGAYILHAGIDLIGWSAIVSPVDGTVTLAAYNGNAGNEVRVVADNGDMFRMLHNSELWVSKGQRVAQGQGVAKMGSTGQSTGTHCHFETHPGGGNAVNPRDYMKAANTETDDFLMGLLQWQQEAIFNALYSPDNYYKTDAIINILRLETNPAVQGVENGEILFPGATYYAFTALANQGHQTAATLQLILELLSKAMGVEVPQLPEPAEPEQPEMPQRPDPEAVLRQGAPEAPAS